MNNILDCKGYTSYLMNVMDNAKIASGGREIQCRCKECSDSSNPGSAHMYISIPDDGKSPSLYHCFKCNCSGIVTYQKLIEWGVYDQNIASQLITYNSSIEHNERNNKYFNRSSYSLIHNYTRMDEKSEEKRKYICDRIGYDLSYQDLCNLKIILNLRDLLSENNITKFTRDHNILSELDREFIGFLSIDNAFVNLRRTCPEGMLYKSIDQRYINYKIFDKYDTSQRFYTIPTMYNMNVYGRVPLHIAEGPFDILSIYLNVRNREPGLYTSIAGNNYIGLILFFMMDMRIPNLELHLYPDNDKYGSMNRMNYIMSQIPDPTIPVYIHYNIVKGEKDFGVPSNRISESIIKLR